MCVYECGRTTPLHSFNIYKLAKKLKKVRTSIAITDVCKGRI